jgi:hypothetical protein
VRLTLNYCYPKKHRVEFKVFYIRSGLTTINKYKVLFLSVNLGQDLEQKFQSLEEFRLCMRREEERGAVAVDVQRVGLLNRISRQVL